MIALTEKDCRSLATYSSNNVRTCTISRRDPNEISTGPILIVDNNPWTVVGWKEKRFMERVLRWLVSLRSEIVLANDKRRDFCCTLQIYPTMPFSPPSTNTPIVSFNKLVPQCHSIFRCTMWMMRGPRSPLITDWPHRWPRIAPFFDDHA